MAFSASHLFKTSSSMSQSASSSTASSTTCQRTRVSHPPLTFAEEQAVAALSQFEQRDVVAAMRLSLASSWESDDETDDFERKYKDESSSGEEEEEKKSSKSMKKEEEWTENVHAFDIPLRRLRS